MTGTGSSATWAGAHGRPPWVVEAASSPRADDSAPGGRRSCSRNSVRRSRQRCGSRCSTLRAVVWAPALAGSRHRRDGPSPAARRHPDVRLLGNVANRQTTGQSYRMARELSDRRCRPTRRVRSQRSQRTGSSRRGNGHGGPPPLISRTGTKSRATRDARHWARPPRPGRACRGLAALLWSKLGRQQLGGRKRHLGGETTYPLSDSSTTLDGQRPVRARQRAGSLRRPPTFRQLDADAVTASWCAGRGPERYDPGLSLAVTR